MVKSNAIPLGLALLLGTAGLSWAQGPGGLNLRELFQQLDANSDMAIDPSEVPEKGRAAFKKLLQHGDTNKDGRLENTELRDLGEKLRAAGVVGGPADLAQRLRAADRDGDGKVTRAEFTGPPEVFERLDKNKDGVITKDEAPPASTSLGQPATPKDESKKAEGESADKPASKGREKPAGGAEFGPRLKAMDKDSDGKLSRAEFPPEVLFVRLDTNKDGFLSPEEAAKLPEIVAKKKKS